MRKLGYNLVVLMGMVFFLGSCGTTKPKKITTTTETVTETVEVVEEFEALLTDTTGTETDTSLISGNQAGADLVNEANAAVDLDSVSTEIPAITESLDTIGVTSDVVKDSIDVVNEIEYAEVVDSTTEVVQPVVHEVYNITWTGDARLADKILGKTNWTFTDSDRSIRFQETVFKVGDVIDYNIIDGEVVLITEE